MRALLLLAALAGPAHAELTVGSKKFTESVVLGELASHLASLAGAQATHRRELGGTRVLWQALQKGDIDIYAEYTGTLVQELLADELPAGADLDAVRAALRRRGLGMSAPLGFNNTYAIATTEGLARERGLTKVSDLARHPGLSLRFGNEFMDRGDGWPALQRAYALPHQDVRGLDHDLAYRGLVAGDVDVMDAYSTDAEIAYYDLTVLTDDKDHFPRYEALWLWREDTVPAAVVAQLRRVEGRVGAAQMAAMNKRAKLDRVPESQVAADFVASTLGAAIEVSVDGLWDRLWVNTVEHLVLVGISMTAAVLLAIPLGVLAFRHPRAGQGILGVVGVLQTVPSLALLVFMIPLLGIGAAPAIVALFLYSLLPIVRNTHAGLTDIPRHLHESATALGLTAAARLRRIELPLAARSILAGIKTAIVINIGTATLGALIGAGGYGQPILTGIRLDDLGLILEGAVPAAILAIAAQGVFELIERKVVPLGLRLGDAAS